MKLGIVFVALGVTGLIALVVLLAMNLVMGNIISAIWGTVYTGIAGGFFLYNGIKRIRKTRKADENT